MIKEAVELIEKYHVGQMYGQFPYTYHLYNVCGLISTYGEFTQVIALLHDILEDTECTEGEIKVLFGEDILNSIKLCSYDVSLPKQERKREFYDRWLNIPSDFEQDHTVITASLVKTADRLSNINHCIAFMEESKLRRYLNEMADFKEAVCLPNVGIKLWLQLEEIMLRYY